jgi:lipopolysaccharide transport protein LptA
MKIHVILEFGVRILFKIGGFIMRKIQIVALVVSFSSFGVFASTKPVDGLNFSADKIVQGKKTDIVELIGNAKVTQGEKTVTGKKITLNVKTGAAIVEGEAQFAAKNMTVNLSNSSASN